MATWTSTVAQPQFIITVVETHSARKPWTPVKECFHLCYSALKSDRQCLTIAPRYSHYKDPQAAMGWLWTSSKDPSASLSSPRHSSQPETLSPPPPAIPDVQFPTTTTETYAVPSDTTPPLSRDEAADAELRAFLESLQASDSPKFSKSTQSTSSVRDRQIAASNSQGSDLITPSNIHPTTLSCRTAFDTAFYCASLGGQFTSLYRYGQLRRCSQEWADFWWCMRTNRGFMSEKEREARIVARGVQREREKYRGEGKLSSEDVWEMRRKMVPATAMQGDLERVLEAQREKREASGEGHRL
ncbi:hypothetical protein ABVK25_005218 [Lepraria finkii]|uniref:Early meiotic induction protein 1 n=1 Tax=Lepraria finkii TaxID=1340010 RepID=A0ABR4B9G9_9LECA